MFRRFISFLLIITVITANLGNCFIYAGFDLNKSYIASTLCENRDKPEMHCNGKCYLAKKIKQAEEKERGQEQQSQKNRFQEALITKKFNVNFGSSIDRTYAVTERSAKLPQQPSAIFHPPPQA